MRQDRKTKNDGYVSFLGGVDSGKAPNLLAENQLAFAVNCTMRGGHVCTRPGFKSIALFFDDTETQDWFENPDNKIQGTGFYNDQLIVSIAGRIFRIDPADWGVREITPTKEVFVSVQNVSPPTNNTVILTISQAISPNAGDPVWIMDGKYVVVSYSGIYLTLQNRSAASGVAIPVGTSVKYSDSNARSISTAWMVQAENYLIIQDGLSAPMIYDGSMRRSNPSASEVPGGTVMAYGMGRLWVATSPRTFVAGDINNGPSEVIKFTENDYLNEGGSFSVPGDAGDITGMIFLSNLDTSLGQGPLLVFTENAIFSINAPVVRSIWKEMTNPIQTVSLNKYGATGQYSIQPINGDVFYRSIDGFRSFILARRDFSTWGNLPISREMTRMMNDEQNMLKFTSTVLFDNRYLAMVSLHPDKTGAYSDAVAVMDFDLLGGTGIKSPPVWEGVWTGLRFTKLITGVINGNHRCFAFSVGTDGDNQLWEITKDARWDEDGCKIESMIETRSMIHGSPFEATELTTSELWVDDLAGEVDWTMKYRPDQHPCWYDWTEWTEEQKARDCAEGTEDNCWEPTEYKPGYRTRMTLPNPPISCDPSDNKPSNLGYEFQFKLKWSGHARIKRWLIKTTEIEEPVAGNMVC